MAELYDKYSVKKLDELILPDKTMAMIRESFKDRNFKHFVFYSKKPGVGKTSLANAISNEYNREKREYTGGSKDSAKSELEDAIRTFAEREYLYGKICIINEAHRMTKIQQGPLISLIDNLLKYTNTALCLTTNDLNTIDKPLLNRMTVINFDFDNTEERAEMRVKFKNRLIEIANLESIPFVDNVMDEILNNNFPSFRGMLGEMEELYLKNGNLNSYEKVDEDKIDIIKLLATSAFNEAYKYFTVNGLLNERIYGHVCDQVTKNGTAPMTPSIASIVRHAKMHSYYHGITSDKELCIYSFLIDLAVMLGGVK